MTIVYRLQNGGDYVIAAGISEQEAERLAPFVAVVDYHAAKAMANHLNGHHETKRPHCTICLEIQKARRTGV